MLIAHIILLCASLALLIWITDILISGAATIAAKHSVSPLIIGVFIIGLGTSLPELSISISGALKKDLPLAIGNAIGSNTANIALVIGICFLIPSFNVSSALVNKYLPIVLITCAAPAVLLTDYHLSRTDGILLLAIFALCSYLTQKIDTPETDGDYATVIDNTSDTTPHPYFKAMGGLVGLLVCTEGTIYAAVEIATAFRVPTHIIGLTILAIGSSLPELISATVSVVRGYSSLAIGNIFGSLMFNAAAISGVATVVYPASLPPAMVLRDTSIMLGLVLLLALFLFIHGFKVRFNTIINTVMGLALLGIFAVYELILYLT